ncbi:hypothetical protein [Nocardia bhagyanarayanae]|uniref:Uncharacterized protein n=1 Tax=Nocardia bhagyanarayanae TaxID=1215925 RepID=A0A543F7M9_9NOCA|nr:hypothetical protein [Nocardia bhagyanarayanae]TQM29847.1 hypothetical protein FB390_1460 [Nocardia bhagyanarayanae]
MEQIGSVTELAVRNVGAAAALGAAIGEDAASRVLHGTATVCDIVLASLALDVDSVQAVVEYAEAVAIGAVSQGEAGSRCA